MFVFFGDDVNEGLDGGVIPREGEGSGGCFLLWGEHFSGSVDEPAEGDAEGTGEVGKEGFIEGRLATIAGIDYSIVLAPHETGEVLFAFNAATLIEVVISIQKSVVR